MKSYTETDSQYICNITAPCFQNLSPQEMSLIQNSKTQVHFRKGDNLTKQGTFASYILFIISGLSKQYIENSTGKNFSISVLRPGEFVGLSSVFDKAIFQYTTTALTDCQAALIEKDAIASVMRQNGEFSFEILRKYCRQNTSLFETLNLVLSKQMNGRLADTLIYLHKIKQEYPTIFQMLSRKELAEFSGITTESAVKLLKTFEKENIIRLSDKDIEILNMNNLLEISRLG